MCSEELHCYEKLAFMPPEIWLSIGDHLSTAEKASFSLCNRSMSTVLGPRYWASLTKCAHNMWERFAFLQLLVRDNPALFYCHRCAQLHPSNKVGPPGLAHQPKQPLSCLQKNRQPNLGDYMRTSLYDSEYTFEFEHMQLVMDRHRYGRLHGISTESLAYIEVVQPSFALRDNILALLSVDARVSSPHSHLIIRIQHWAVTHSRARSSILRELRYLEICPHVTMRLRTSRLPAMIKRALDARNTGSLDDSFKEAIHRCRECNLDFQLQCDDVEGVGLAIVVTKWLDLGLGEVIMNEYRPPNLVHSLMDHWDKPVEWHQLGAIRAAFERDETLSQESLYSRNLSLLVGKRYKSTMGRWLSNTWILQAGEPVSRDVNWTVESLQTFLCAARIFLLSSMKAAISATSRFLRRLW